MVINSTYLILREEVGTAIPSLSSKLLERGVSPEEEDLMWVSHIYLGMFGSRPYGHW